MTETVNGMPDTTLKELVEKLKRYIELAENTHNLFIAPLWVSEAKVLVKALDGNEWMLE